MGGGGGEEDFGGGLGVGWEDEVCSDVVMDSISVVPYRLDHLVTRTNTTSPRFSLSFD